MQIAYHVFGKQQKENILEIWQNSPHIFFLFRFPVLRCNIQKQDNDWGPTPAYFFSIFFRFVTMKVSHFAANSNDLNRFSKLLGETQGCFICLKLVFHDHLQWRKWSEKLAMMHQDVMFHDFINHEDQRGFLDKIWCK